MGLLPDLVHRFSPGELSREKQKDYRNVVIAQILIIVSGFLLADLLDTGTLVSKIVTTFYSLFGVVYAFLLWDLLRDFTSKKWLINLFFYLLLLLVVFGLLVEFPFYRVIELKDRQTFFTVFHGLLFPVEVTVIAYTIRDVFGGTYLRSDKLWGAACVYLMIGISFGSLYDAINVAIPGSFGAVIPAGWNSYSESVYYSFNILGGLDTNYPDTSKLIRNIGVIEAVWGNLFAILIIGKLLTMPRKKQD